MIDTRISPDLEKRMHELCDDIASAESLSPELHDELYAHIEDKMLGYLSGEEALSEADAFVLAREHFGDRVKVREKLEEIHPMDLTFKVSRRLLVAAIVYVTLFYIAGYFVLLAMLLPVYSMLGAALYMMIKTIVVVLFVCLQFQLLIRWKRNEENGKDLWYQRCSMGWLLMLMGLMVIVGEGTWMIRDVLIHAKFADVSPATNPVVHVSKIPQFYYPALSLCAFGGSLLAWFTWFDIRPRPNLIILRVVLAFTLCHTLMSAVRHAVIVWPPNIIDPKGYLLFELGGYRTCLTSFYNIKSWIVKDIQTIFVPILCAWLAYTLWSFYRHKRNDTSGLVIAKN